MTNTNKFKFTLTLRGIVGFFLAISPVLDPYIFLEIGTGFTLKINDFIMLVLAIFCFMKYKKEINKTNYLCKLLLGLFLITIFANINSFTNIENSLKNIIVWFIDAIALMYIWKSPCRDQFLFWVKIIATVASIIVIAQFILGYLGINMWNGRFFFLDLGKYDGWSGYIDKNTGDIRPNGIFQEASYVGLYLSVAYAQAFKELNQKKIMFYALTMLLTTSMVAVVLCFAITVHMLIEQKNRKINIRIFILIIIVIIGLFVLGSMNDSVQQSLIYIFRRIKNFNSDLSGARMSSTKYRILGHIYLFKRYSFIEKLIGVGIGQYAPYFNVTSYSNVWVTTILNSGILGCFIVILMFISMFIKTNKNNKVFLLILFLMFSSDYQWFSWYFFYLISACILKENSIKSKECLQ